MTNGAFFNLLFPILSSSVIATAFHAFDTQHIVILCIIAFLCFQVARAAKAESLSRSRWLRWSIGFCLLGYGVFFYTQQGIAGALTWQYSLPLELCDLVLIFCILSLFRPNQFATEIAYFWGFGGVLQAIVTPELAQGFPSMGFILFFWSHGATLIAIVFLIMSRDFRPRNCSILRMMIALNVYGLAVGGIDAIMGWNYGYLCSKPSTPSLMDLLGPWPWYLFSLELIAFFIFLILEFPWRVWAFVRRRKQPSTPDK